MPCPLSVSLSKSGPFPRPALPGVLSRTDLSATLPARPAPHGVPVGACTPPIGLPVLLRLPSSMHAGTPTPAETVRCICRFSSRSVVGLPLISGGSAPALPVSRPARCSHHIPACMVAKLLNTALCHQSASVYIVTSVDRPGCYQPKATIVGWCSHTPGKRAFPRRTEKCGLFRRVGLRVARFEACSAFTRVAARMVAEPPRAARYTEVFQSKSLPPSTAPIATGWSDCCRAGFAPAEGRRLSTAH